LLNLADFFRLFIAITITGFGFLSVSTMLPVVAGVLFKLLLVKLFIINDVADVASFSYEYTFCFQIAPRASQKVQKSTAPFPPC
jgi:hypothetical protein